MINPQILWTFIAAAVAALPGLAAFWLWKRQASQRITAEADLRQQMLEQLNAQQKSIRFLVNRVDELEKARAEEYAETEILRQETEDLRQEVRELTNGVAALTRQIEAAGMTPAWNPPDKGKAKRVTVKIDTPALVSFVTEHFDMDELSDLAMRLDLDIENVAGSDKEAKVHSLVQYMKRRKRLTELIDLVRSLRPGGEF